MLYNKRIMTQLTLSSLPLDVIRDISTFFFHSRKPSITKNKWHRKGFATLYLFASCSKALYSLFKEPLGVVQNLKPCAMCEYHIGRHICVGTPSWWDTPHPCLYYGDRKIGNKCFSLKCSYCKMTSCLWCSPGGELEECITCGRRYCGEGDCNKIGFPDTPYWRGPYCKSCLRNSTSWKEREIYESDPETASSREYSSSYSEEDM